MEMSKASSGSMTVNVEWLDIGETVNQALGEFADKLNASRLNVVYQPPQEMVYVRADGRLTWRVLSNLLGNAVKYAMPGTRLYFDLTATNELATLSLKNISREPLNVDAQELMERFVRGDASRNTEGSGLGLNIAKSLMEVQGGQLELTVDGDLFKVTLTFPVTK
jgi:K+-sensing histidine kinase KdpD